MTRRLRLRDGERHSSAASSLSVGSRHRVSSAPPARRCATRRAVRARRHASPRRRRGERWKDSLARINGARRTLERTSVRACVHARARARGFRTGEARGERRRRPGGHRGLPTRRPGVRRANARAKCRRIHARKRARTAPCYLRQRSICFVRRPFLLLAREPRTRTAAAHGRKARLYRATANLAFPGTLFSYLP